MCQRLVKYFEKKKLSLKYNCITRNENYKFSMTMQILLSLKMLLIFFYSYIFLLDNCL